MSMMIIIGTKVRTSMDMDEDKEYMDKARLLSHYAMNKLISQYESADEEQKKQFSKDYDQAELDS